MSAKELNTLYVGGDHCVAVLGNLLLMVVRNDPEPSFARLLPLFVKRLKAQATGPIGFFVVVRADTPPPGEEARATLRSAFQTFNASMAFGALTLETTGFVGASMRSVVNLLLLATRPTFPLKVFGSVDEAARWLLQTQPQAEEMSQSALVQIVESLRADYAAGTLRETRSGA
jgi:hypothetical protein